MKNLSSCVLLTVIVLAACLESAPRAEAQDERGSAPAPVEPKLAPEIAAALARDPRTLPDAPEGKWKDFDAAKPKREQLTPELYRAREALMGGDVLSAIVALQAALDAQPDFPPALHQLGLSYYRLQRYGDAALMFERFLRHSPSRVGETRALGHCWYSLGRYAEAQAHYERVLEHSARDVEAWRGHALCRMRQGDAAGALEGLDRVLEIDPRHAEAWGWKAHVLLDLDRFAEAETAALHGRDLDPFAPRPWFLLSEIWLELGKEREASDARAKFQELDSLARQARTLEGWLVFAPRDVELAHRLVDLHAASGNMPRAREALARLVVRSPRDRATRCYALDVLDRLGDREQARSHAAALNEIADDDLAAWKRLEVFYTKDGDLAHAAAAAARVKAIEARTLGPR